MAPEELRELILADAYLRHIYASAYSFLDSLVNRTLDGPVIEIGAGSGISREFVSGIITTDLVHSNVLDISLNALHLPFRDESVSALVMKDALHHIPDPERFLREAERVLVPGGGLLVMDPYWGWLASLVYKWLHPEPFDDTRSSWSFVSSGPNDSNQAILKMILRRDRGFTGEVFPNFRILECGTFLGPSFLLSGGLHGRTPLPSRFLIKMYDWETRQGRWLDPFRFEFVTVFAKVGSNECS